MAGPARPSPELYRALVATFVVYSLAAAYYAATRPVGTWRSPFSWHPFLMILGMVGCAGVSVVTKKLGGYTNTKIHAALAVTSVVLSLGGLYAIYSNKELYERPHFTSLHGKTGVGLVFMYLFMAIAGSTFLHPDFGIDKTNQTIRKIHRTVARIVMACAWVTSFQGMYKMTQDPLTLFLFGLPLVVLMPFTLL